MMALTRNIQRLGFGTRRAALCLFAWAALSCAPSGFQDEAFINSVRILASAADKPYAKPGDTVNLSVLAFDGRPIKPEPMKIFWLPFVCKDPLNDAYYGCFGQIASGMGGGGSGPMPDAICPKQP
jgi:hypothetical protein